LLTKRRGIGKGRRVSEMLSSLISIVKKKQLLQSETHITRNFIMGPHKSRIKRGTKDEGT